MAKYYYTEDVPKRQNPAGSPGRASSYETRSRVVIYPAADPLEFVYGVYRANDSNEIFALDAWSSRGGGCTKARWLELWSARAPASIIADVQANG